MGSESSVMEEARSRPTIVGWACGLFAQNANVVLDGGDHAAHRTLVPQVPGQGAGVYPFDAQDTVLFEEGGEGFSLAQLLWYGVYSRTRTAAAWILADSSSPGMTP